MNIAAALLIALQLAALVAHLRMMIRLTREEEHERRRRK